MRLRWLATAALALGLAGSVEAGEAPNIVGKQVGKDFPDIQVADWVGNWDGRTTVAEHLGEVVLLELWGTH